MNPLLYSSNEMFSSTELIRKSKMIFDKLLNAEVEKAIILRDGKPGFMLLEFEKYEELMKEYMALKEQVESNTTVITETKEIEKEVVVEQIVEEPEQIIAKEEVVEEIAQIKEVEEPKTQAPHVDETSEEQFEHIEEDISEDELKKALEDIEKLTFSKEEEEKKDIGLEEFGFQDDFTDVVKERKEQPLKEFWD